MAHRLSAAIRSTGSAGLFETTLCGAENDRHRLFSQTTASVEHLQHWENGNLRRELRYHLDSGGWITQEGPPQAWESTYFFSDDEGTENGERWPRGLPDDISEVDLDRYNRAKESGNPSEIMDLLGEGDLVHLCRSYGIDPDRPHAHHRPSPNLRPWLILGLVVGGLVLAFVCGY